MNHVHVRSRMLGSAPTGLHGPWSGLRGAGLALLVLAGGACGSPIGTNPDGFDFGHPGDAGGVPGSGESSASSDHTTRSREVRDATTSDDASTGEDAEPSEDDAAAPVVDCPPNATLIYVTGEGSALYSFNPTTGSFTHIGILTCLDSPTHMTVDRTGTAWVVSDGLLYKASTTDASCTRVKTWKADPTNFPDFALTFLGTTSATDTSLYILGDGGELGIFDVAAGGVTNVGTLSISPSGDMTTNGDGTLYYLMQAAKQTLNEVDPTSASVLHSWPTGEDSENTQALAYYGGLFYDFIGSDVYTFDTATKKATSIGTAPIMVTGAGQSTCVPTDAGPPVELR